MSEARLAELLNRCDTKTKEQIDEGLEFLKLKGHSPEAYETKVVDMS